MTRKWESYGHIALTGLAVAVGGCAAPQLQAVQATGAVGHRVSSNETVLAAIPALCLEIASLSGANDDCSALRDQARSWARVVSLIDAYSSALSRPNHHHVGITGAMLPVGSRGKTWSGLKPDDAAAATALANIARDLLTQGHEEGEMRKTIEAADGPIQKLARAVESEVDRRVASIDLAETSIDVVRQRLQQTVADPPPSVKAVRIPATPPRVGDKRPNKGMVGRVEEPDPVQVATVAMGVQVAALNEAVIRQAVTNQAAVPGAFAGLAAIQNDLEATRRRFEELRDAVDVFARAHKTLHDHVDQLDTSELFATVLRAIGDTGGSPDVAAPTNASVVPH